MMIFPTPRVLLPFGILLALGCGARSPLELLEEEGAGGEGMWSSGGRGGSGGVGVGGYVGSGGRMGSGGMPMGGMMVSGGRPGTGGTVLSGGRPGTGGTISSGGRPGTGGTISSGGRGGNVGGSAGGVAGSAGGQGGGGRGGSPAVGGRAGGAGGMAGAIGGMLTTGGTIGSGGVRPSGGTIGTGGALTTGGTVGTGGSPCPALGPNEELIDDLNDGDRFLPPLSGRSGAWTNRADSSPNAKIFPDPATGFVPSATGDACRKYAAYVYGGGCVLSGCSFWFGLGSPYNASKYTGITFWAKIDANTSPGIRVAFPDKDTEPFGNLCETDPPPGSTNGCWDHYGQYVTLTTTWTKYSVSFASLKQGNWGRQGTAFDPATLYRVEFDIDVNATFAIWIDDVAFTM